MANTITGGPDLYSVTDLAALIKKSRKRADQLVKEPSFPLPVYRDDKNGFALWDYQTMKHWAEMNGYLR
jgi:hypothetical protein